MPRMTHEERERAAATLDAQASARVAAAQSGEPPGMFADVEAGAATAPPSVRLVRGDAVKLEPVRWAWPGFVPLGMLTILGGPAGVGKTTIAMALGAIITRGAPWPDGSRCADPGDVIVWSGEDPPAVLAARLKAAGADLQRVHFVEGIAGGEAFDPGRDMPLLEVTAAKLDKVRLLILDPIVSAVSGDGHKSNDVRRALQPVVDMGHRLGCAVIGITHFSKGTAGRDPVERITGSLAFAALARMVLVAAKVKADDGGEPRHVLLRAKSNVGPDDGGFGYALERVEVAPEVEGQRVQWLEQLQGSARDVLAIAEAEPDESGDGDSPADVEAFVRGCLADGPVSAKTMRADADGAGYSWDRVKRAASRLGVERRKEGMRGGWVWALHAEGSSNTEGSTEECEGSEGSTLQSAASFAEAAPKSAEECKHETVLPSHSSHPSVLPSAGPAEPAPEDVEAF